jgi:inner membrane protein
MGRKLGVKAVVIGVLVVVLLVPLLMLRGLVDERQARAAQVRAEIAQSSSRSQRLLGPLLRLQIERTERVLHTALDRNPAGATVELRKRLEWQLLTPDTLEVDTRQQTEQRRRGLFGARLYHDDSTLSARFTLPAPPPLDDALADWRIVDAALLLGLGDSRGIRSLRIDAGGLSLEPLPGTGVGWIGDGVQAELPAALLTRDAFEVEMRLALTGTEQVSWVPVGGQTRIELHSDWPHPSFNGDRLPETRRIDADGFRAVWTVSRLASRAQQLARDCGVDAGPCGGIAGTAFGVSLVDPVDRYLKTERAMKYSLLFLLLMFGAVFLIEALAELDVHPFQYGMTGLALAMFFLLLLALTEHVGFGAAYAVAALACVALIATYMAAALRSRSRSLLFGGLLGGLYALLYGLLQSEDHALLIGSLALFALLAVAMLVTRRLDWYRLAAERGGGGVV